MSYALIDDDILQLCCAVRMGDILNVKMLLEFVPDIDLPDTVIIISIFSFFFSSYACEV
jgi:hypothetical protein